MPWRLSAVQQYMGMRPSALIPIGRQCEIGFGDRNGNKKLSVCTTVEKNPFVELTFRDGYTGLHKSSPEMCILQKLAIGSLFSSTFNPRGECAVKKTGELLCEPQHFRSMMCLLHILHIEEDSDLSTY